VNAFQALQKLQAWKEGHPLPRGETLHFPISDDEGVLVLAFVRMGGESSPWGIAFGSPASGPNVRTVTEPRDREQVAAMVAEFAPALLEHVLHPEYSGLVVSSHRDERPLRQLWVPNSSHVDMLHHLAYAYTFARKGQPERVPVLNSLGRAAGWLFREFNRPGQVSVMAASDALRESYTFPCEEIRQGHLGYLLAWLETRGNLQTRLAAVELAERRSISTSLDPAVERDDLAERVERFAEARREVRKSDERRAAREIAQILQKELEHRFERTVAAIERLRGDRRRLNRGVKQLVADAHASQWWEYLQTERKILDNPGARVFIPSPETDRHSATAAAHYFVQQGCEERRASLLLEDDREMQAEALAAGEAIQGTIRAVAEEGTGRASKPVWTVETDGEAPTKLRKGQMVFVARLRSRKGRIRDVSIRGGNTLFELEITALKTQPRVNVKGAVLKATDKALRGTVVMLLPSSLDGIHELKKKKLYERGTPGSWVTDARPGGYRADLPTEVSGLFDGPRQLGGSGE
jgi:hypothetical protein